MLDNWLAAKLADRKQKGLVRILPRQNDLADFTSNDYLGLARSEELHDIILEAVSRLRLKNGATGSRLLSGNSLLAEHLEEKLAGIFRSQATLIFNSGYSANIAVLSSIPQKDDCILYDELAHASIKDGARLSLAKRYSFRHNDLNDLERKISKCTGRIFVAVESIYSMDGDECPLEDLVKLSEKHGFSIILDEAHSTGVRGPEGAGICVEKALEEKVDIRIYTFGKAMGVCGACVSGSRDLIRYLVNFARPFIYTTALAPYTVAAIDCAFRYLSSNPHLQNILENKIQLYLQRVSTLQNRTPSLSAIQTCIIPGNERIRGIAAKLQQQGFDVRPILYPTVARGKERLRICLHTYNAEDQVVALTTALTSISDERHPQQSF